MLYVFDLGVVIILCMWCFKIIFLDIVRFLLIYFGYNSFILGLVVVYSLSFFLLCGRVL